LDLLEALGKGNFKKNLKNSIQKKMLKYVFSCKLNIQVALNPIGFKIPNNTPRLKIGIKVK